MTAEKRKRVLVLKRGRERESWKDEERVMAEKRKRERELKKGRESES